MLSKLKLGEGDFSRGKKITIFSVDRANSLSKDNTIETESQSQKLKFAVIICYESVFPDLVRKFVKRGAELLVVITNDAWFGKTTAPFQHAQIAVYRAIENRISIARCANTGISMFIDPYGRIRKSTKWFEEAVIVDDIELGADETFSTKYGNIFTIIITIANVVPLGLAAFKIKSS